MARPWTYPGRPAEGSGILIGTEYLLLEPSPDGGAARLRSGGRHGADDGCTDDRERRLDEVLRTLEVAPLAERTLVLAVGSNASPAVLRRKFATLGAAPVVPLVSVLVEGLAVGHSAHVSLTGFIAATGFHRAGARTATFASLLDDTQLACLDATEPNYERRVLTADQLPVTLDGGSLAAQVQLYDSRWGVLGSPVSDAATPQPLLPQEELYAWLAQHCPPWRRLVDPGPDHRATMRRLAAAATLRESVQDTWASLGWSHASGLAGSN